MFEMFEPFRIFIYFIFYLFINFTKTKISEKQKLNQNETFKGKK